MRINLDRAIRFEGEPKHKGLYQWSLQEVDKGGKAGRDQIPWALSHSFAATELTLHEGNAAKSKYQTSGTWIRATLTPGKGRRDRAPSYSMFGTDRTIDRIQLFIHPIGDDGEKPTNTVWVSGFPSYTSDDPLSGGTEPDFLQFDLILPQNEYDRIADRIAHDQIDAASLRLHAHGFYSDWTPDIETDEFKVLCGDYKEQSIELPEGCEVEPPRLGEVWDVAFSIQKVVKPRLYVEQLRRDAAEANTDVDEDWAGPVMIDQPPDPRWVKSFYAEVKTVKLLMGAIVAILALGLLFK